jgi:glycosyltransferase involved in cell wall biosynthesis
VVTVGRLDLQKGQIHLLRAVDDLVHRRGKKHLRLHVAGQGPLENELKAFVQERNLGNQVHFVGFLPNPFALISRCQLFCLPSVYEGLPLALLEAMACRVPVLATDCPSGPREVLADGTFGRLVRPNAPAELAAALEHAVDHYSEWMTLADAARQRVEQAFSSQSEIPKLERVIDEACRTFGAFR